MDTTTIEGASIEEIWARVADRVRREVDVATVWLAMDAVNPLTIDGNFFVAALKPGMDYLAINLQGFEATTAIEESLQAVTGRVLAFRLIEGQTLLDWQREKVRTAGSAAPSRPVASTAPPPTASPTFLPGAVPPPIIQESTRTVYPTWEKLSDRLVQGYKTAPLVKYPHGQARYIMECVQMISDTMDVQMPPPGQPRDDAQERTLAKMLERLGSVTNLDPLFISLELLRYRQRVGKDIGL